MVAQEKVRAERPRAGVETQVSSVRSRSKEPPVGGVHGPGAETPNRATLVQRASDPEIELIVVESTHALLRSYLRGSHFHGRVDGPHTLAPNVKAAIVGFTEADIRGALTVTCTDSLLYKSYPASAPQWTNVDLRDWAGELGNQLLGRLKNQLSRRQLSLQVSTPVAMHAQVLGAPPLDELLGQWLHFGTLEGDFWVRLDFQAPPDWQLQSPDEDADHMEEGDLLLF